MTTRYIQKNKDGLWAISNTKTGKALRNADTQKEAIALAGAMKSTESIMIKRASGWTPATGWDKQIASITHSKKPAAKKPAAKKPATKAPVKKAPAKKAVATKAPAKKAVTTKVPTKKEKPTKSTSKEAAPVVVVSKPQKETPAPKKEAAKSDKSSSKGISGLIGFIIGVVIIASVVGLAFVLGYYVL